MVSERALSRTLVTHDEAELRALTKLLVKDFKVPGVHGLEAVLFLEEGIDVEQREVVVLDLHCGSFGCAVHDSRNLGTVSLELLCLFNDIGEATEDELVLRNVT